jgi:hypothetical protein
MPVPVPDAADVDARDADVATRDAAISRLADAVAAGCVMDDCPTGDCPTGDRVIVGFVNDDCALDGRVDRDGRDGDVLAAIFSATRLSAAMITAGSGASPPGEPAPTSAPAVAAVEYPADLAGSSDSAGVFVSIRHRSSHSSTVPPQPLTYAESTGRSGSPGPASAALM